MAIRDYTESDDVKLQQLEIDLVQPLGDEWPHTSIVIGPVFHQPYITKARLFPESVVLVAEEGGQIVGTVTAGVKVITANTRVIKAACVFDLKVRNSDLKLALLTELELRLRALQVTLVYSHVPDADEDTFAVLSAKLGYKEVSQRRVIIRTNPGPRITVVKLPKSDALRFTQDQYSKRNLLPEDLEAIFDSPNYKGTFTATDETGNVAGLSIWDCSVRYRSSVLKCVLEPETVRKYWKWLLALYLAVVALQFWFMFFFFDLIDEPLLQVCLFSGGAYASVMTASTTLDLYTYTNLVLTNHATRRGRIFGLIYKGAYVSRDDLIRIVVEGTLNKALSLGLNVVTISMDDSDNDSRHFPSSEFSATVLQKKLLASDLDRWAPHSFQDPREFSL